MHILAGDGLTPLLFPVRACSVDRGLIPKRKQYREGLSGSLPCHLIPVGNLPPNPSLYAMCSV
jgi:hypothetical protein